MTGNLSDYVGLVTSEHKNKPNFIASLEASVQPLVDMQYLCNNLYSYLDIDYAIGAQLDIIGLWLGISRTLAIPLTNVFFSWDTLGLGWDQGVWYSPFDPTTGQTQMNDATYRAVLKMRAALDGWDGTVGALDEYMIQPFQALFPGLMLYILDNYNMTFTYRLYGNSVLGIYGVGGLTQIIQQLFLQGLLTIKPVGVKAIFQIWNGSAWVSSPFNYAISLSVPASISSALPVTSISVSGMILPQGDAQTIRLQVGASNVAPPAGIGNSSPGSGNPPPSAGAYYYTPTTYNNTAGTFSTNLPVDITVAGTYYVWAFDLATGLAQCSNAIMIS